MFFFLAAVDLKIRMSLLINDILLAAFDLPTSWCASRGAFLVAQSHRSSQRPRGGGRGVVFVVMIEAVAVFL